MITLALILTPVASAKALAALCALDGIDVDVVPTSRGAVAVRAVAAADDGRPPAAPAAARTATRDADVPALPTADLPDAGSGADEPRDWDIAELFASPGPARESGPGGAPGPGGSGRPGDGSHVGGTGGQDGLEEIAEEWAASEEAGLLDDVPPEARDLAARISLLTKVGVVLVTARLTQDEGWESGLSGQINAQRYLSGEQGEELAAGLVLAGTDDVVEDLLLGRRSVVDVPGHVSSRDTGRPRRGRRFGRGPRRSED